MSSVLFCDNCHNILYPTRQQDAEKIIYMCKICFFETDAENIPNHIFYSQNYNSQKKLSHTNKYMPYDFSLKRKNILVDVDGNSSEKRMIEVVSILDDNLREIFIECIDISKMNNEIFPMQFYSTVLNKTVVETDK